MAAMTLPDPPFHTLPALADKWGVHPDVINAYLADGVLSAVEVDLAGMRVPAVTYAERCRFEKAAGVLAKPINPTERNTLLAILGAIARIAYVDDVRQVYGLAETVMEDAARMGIPLELADETLASKFKEAFALLRQRGAKGFDSEPA